MSHRSLKGALMGAAAAAGMLWAGLAQAVGVPGQGTWETTLQPRELDGNAVNGPEAFYDTALDITWLRNANVNGLMNWATAKTWADTLVVAGVSGWRLPKVVDTGAPGCDRSNAGGTDCGYNVNTATGEMAHLYYVTLGNLADCAPGDAACNGPPQPGYGLTNTGGFQGLRDAVYHAGTAYAPNSSWAWRFIMGSGDQFAGPNSIAQYAMAVRPGDVAAVPEPQTYAMMLLGIGGLLLAVRRRTR